MAHAFKSATAFPNAAAARNLLARLLPARRALVSAASYCEPGHGIQPHDDKAFRAVAGLRHSRAVACVLHLSQGWRAEHGGLFLDLQQGADAGGGNNPDDPARAVVPAFNTLVAFKVPRMHAVTPVAPGAPPRLSLFGWWLQPGELYDLDVDRSGSGGDEEGRSFET